MSPQSFRSRGSAPTALAMEAANGTQDKRIQMGSRNDEGNTGHRSYFRASGKALDAQRGSSPLVRVCARKLRLSGAGWQAGHGQPVSAECLGAGAAPQNRAGGSILLCAAGGRRHWR